MKRYLDRFFGWAISFIQVQKGTTLAELVVVLAVGGTLATALGISFDGWKRGYEIESATKEIYSDLMDARVRALQRNRTHFVSLSNTRYTIFEDSNPAPDGNDTLETTEDAQVLQREFDVRSPITWSGSRDKTIAFTQRGLSNDNKTICIFSESKPDYDCVEVSRTRINIGKLLKQPGEGGQCLSENCVSR